VIAAAMAAAVAPLLALSLLVAPGPAAATVQPAATGRMEDTCSVEDATLTWGFKESFRSYISGTIANGEWTVADGATYETPEFGFHGGTGTYDAQLSRIVFTGSVRFTGHGGILNTTVANPRIEWSGTSGILYLDVTGTTQEGEPVDERSVNFATLVMPGPGSDPDPKVFNDISAILTEQGAAAFGTYEAGEPLDAITLDLGVVDDDAKESCALLYVTTPKTWWLVFGTIAAAIFVVVALVAVTVVTLRRRRRVA
jgi:hypothetical protein